MSQTKAQLLDGSVVSVSFGAGSAAAPSINYSADTTTGIYFPTSTQLAFSTAGVQRLLINGTGNVNIPGTFSVTGQITAASGSVSTPSILLNGGGNPGIYSPAANQLAIVGGGSTFLTASSSALTATVPHVVPAGTATAASHQIGTGTTYAPGIYSPGADQLAISTSGTGRVFVSSAGLVGIGTTATASSCKLNVDTGINCNGLNVSGIGGFFNAASKLGIDNNGGISRFYSSGANSSTKGSYDFRITDSVGTLDTSAVVIDNSGRVGIGTTSPGQALEVLGTIYSQNNATTVVHFQAADTGAATDEKTWRIAQSQRAAKSIQLGVVVNDASNVAYAAISVVRSGATLDNIQFATGSGSERARIDSSGRLLVGLTGARGLFFSGAVAAQTQIEGNSTGTASLSITRNDATADGNALILAKARSTSYAIVQYVNGTTSDDRIGRISFQGADGTNMVPAAEINAFVDGTPGANDMPGRLVFSTTADGAASPTERMRITNGGAITCGPQVSGSDLVGTEACGFVADGVYAPVYKVKSSLTSNKYAALFFNGNGQVGNILMSGSSTAYNTSSDYRLKENVTAVTDGITRLQELKPSRFNFKADPDHTVDGFIAHEAQAVVPECVTGEKDAVDADGNPVYQGIDQSKLVPLLTAALQEAIAKIETLEARLTALEAA